ncbi:MAG: hypothetical protein KAV87_51125 [Desulfobacteraceae bacterium]|nr:hypothetical protein [Desulfobacteraceae bacterium]
MPNKEFNFHIRLTVLKGQGGAICDIHDDVEVEVGFTPDDAICAYLYGAFTCAKLNGISPAVVIGLAEELSKTDFKNPERVPVIESGITGMVKA